MEEIEEVECNMCGSLMWYDEENGIYVCTNFECTRYNDESDENLNISDVITSKNHLTKDEIISNGDWYEADYINLMEGYFWKHKNIKEDGYVFYMRRYKNDGFTTIIEQGEDDNKLFEGYLKNIEELKQIIHLCRLHEI